MKLHPWFITGAALAVGALVGRWLPHPLFICFFLGCVITALIGMFKTLKRWDGS